MCHCPHIWLHRQRHPYRLEYWDCLICGDVKAMLVDAVEFEILQDIRRIRPIFWRIKLISQEIRHRLEDWIDDIQNDESYDKALWV